MSKAKLNRWYKKIITKNEEHKNYSYDRALDRYKQAVKTEGGVLISGDWKDMNGVVKRLIKIMKKNGFAVHEDPQHDGSDTYGWVVFPPKQGAIGGTNCGHQRTYPQQD